MGPALHFTYYLCIGALKADCSGLHSNFLSKHGKLHIYLDSYHDVQTQRKITSVQASPTTWKQGLNQQQLPKPYLLLRLTNLYCIYLCLRYTYQYNKCNCNTAIKRYYVLRTTFYYNNCRLISELNLLNIYP